MTEDNLKSKGAILIPTVEYGFENYNYYYIEGSSLEISQKVKELVLENGYEHSYVDFYYGRLKEEEREVLDNHLTKEEIEFIKTLDTKNCIYFPLNEKLLELTLKLSLSELLFSTYYFCKTPCTVWGNYNHVFPVFYKK